MSRFVDLSNKRFGKLTVVSRNREYDSKIVYWNCECDCGNKTIVSSSNLKRGSVVSCGCYRLIANSIHHKKYNAFDLDNEDYGIGYTNRGEYFIFDKEDYDKIKMICWHKGTKGYFEGLYNGKTIKLHRLIMSAKHGDIVDHINHKTYDNRKINLRICNSSQNSMNRAKKCTNTSGYPGISYSKHNDKWRVRIGVNNKRISLGCFGTIEEAIAVRKEAEEKYFGEFSYKNSVKEE